MDIHLKKLYEKLLASYMTEPKEDHLYSAQQLSKWFIEKRVSPEEVINVHIGSVKRMVPELPKEVKATLEMLLEVMVGYGVAYQEREQLMSRQRELEDEIEVAAGLQQTLLPESTPSLPGVDIGVISVASKQMSGDYYNFVDHGMQQLGVGIADIVGKGIPAALCMSMIKYTMDRLDAKSLSPGEILRDLNTIVERNVLPSMFITMIYGVYDSLNHQFRYATAGHEPGLIYSAREDCFTSLETKGMVLGVLRDNEYPEYVADLEPNDAIILFTDGVTEARVDGKFIERETIKSMIRDHIHLPAQQAVEAIHQKLYEMTNYIMRDDQTILMIKRVG
jgi:phosphoserine phosphatase RsbU/P